MKVRDPQAIGSQRLELALHEIIRFGTDAGDGGAFHLATHHSGQPGGFHQSLDGAAGDRDAFPVQRQPHLPRAIHAEVVGVDPADVLQQHGVALLPFGGQLVAPLVVGRRGNRHTMLGQHGTDRLHPPSQPALGRRVVGMLADEIHDHCPGRPSSAAKKTEAAFKIALARFSSAFSRFNRLISADSSLDMPGRSP